MNRGRDGRPGASPGEQLRQVIYLSLFPNVLLSLHPDYVMTHLVRPLGPDRTLIEGSWAFAPEAVARPGVEPGDAGGFWDPPKRQARAAPRAGPAGRTS